MGKLTNLNPLAAIADTDIPSTITRDAEYIAADKAHLAASHPHPQYARMLNSFESPSISPVNLAANSWQAVGDAVTVGEQGNGTLWDVMVYFQYVDTSGGFNQPYFQYAGGGTLATIFWQADLLVNEGILVPFEAHNEPDFTARIRFGRGQQRKLEIKPDRAINIASPGFMKVSGIRRL